LRPPELEDVGLAAALRSFVRERFNAERIELSFDGSERRFDAEEGLIVYRIAQEALSNAARHARAGRIRLEIRGEEDSRAVLLKVSDDGCGFDRRRMRDRTAGLGLYGMEERAQLLDGRIEIHSREGEGTTVQVRIPFEAEK
jgi:signal transduction histidine kinase